MFSIQIDKQALGAARDSEIKEMKSCVMMWKIQMERKRLEDKLVYLKGEGDQYLVEMRKEKEKIQKYSEKLKDLLSMKQNVEEIYQKAEPQALSPLT